MGLIINIYRGKYESTNGGISSKFQELTLVNAEGPFEPAEDRPAVIMESHFKGILRIVPADAAGARLPGWFMAGGNYAATSDSRFGELAEALIGARFYGAIAIHDRLES